MVCLRFLRNGIASGKFAAFAGCWLDWSAWLPAHDHLRHFRPRRPGIPQAPQMASRRLQRLRADLLSLSLPRSEEHTSELQSRLHLVCRLLLEKIKFPRSMS